ncbi:cyclin-like protein [Filobasidium floriforme]|uniref:cyclin-like protein n=1 Tax=Filobasidium floriforme TaxID=5210 RepID=UPI001E8D1640|nr:cyclin-like protein [Filobasidium floriforme]KAH8084584.1 cyclin-like protein [Filobasidium floriforme]
MDEPLSKTYRPYFTPKEISALSARQRGKQSTARDEKHRQIACGFIEAVGSRAGFPRRTIATAQSLYHRFHLFFPLKDFNYVEVSLTTIYVSSKLHDTLKKPRDIIISSYAIRYPDLLKGRSQIDISSVDIKQLEHDRKKVLAIERLVLETICFNFLDAGAGAGSGKADVFGLVMKLGRKMRFSKRYIQHAWRLAIDTFRTLAPLQQPPHIVALASLYTASLLLISPVEADRLKRQNITNLEADEAMRALLNETTRGRMIFEDNAEWEQDLQANLADVDEVVHDILDMYIVILSSLALGGDAASTPLASPHSPSDPASSMASAQSSNSTQNRYLLPSFSLPSYWTSSTLTQLKIQLHQSRADGIGGRPKVNLQTPIETTFGIGISDGARAGGEKDAWLSLIEGLGKNEGTVRFVFG